MTWLANKGYENGVRVTPDNFRSIVAKVFVVE
jgi:hypothetical protein